MDALPALTTKQGEDAVLVVRRAVRARARGPRRDQLGALRQGLEHRGVVGARHRQDDDPPGVGRSTWGGSRRRVRRRAASATVCEQVAGLTDKLVDAIDALEHAQHGAHEAGSVEAEARAFVEDVIPAQVALRAVADELETVVSDDLWPLPKYRELLFQY